MGLIEKILTNDESTKKIRNEVELLILLYGDVLNYDKIYQMFEVSTKTFKRDIQVLKFAFEALFDDDAKIIKLTNQLSYKLIIPHKPILLI